MGYPPDQFPPPPPPSNAFPPKAQQQLEQQMQLVQPPPPPRLPSKGTPSVTSSEVKNPVLDPIPSSSRLVQTHL